jgi:hypothetical protein
MTCALPRRLVKEQGPPLHPNRRPLTYVSVAVRSVPRPQPLIASKRERRCTDHNKQSATSLWTERYGLVTCDVAWAQDKSVSGDRVGFFGNLLESQ